MFLTYIIKPDIREILRLYFKHICLLLLFLVFPGKLALAVKVNNLAHITLLTWSGQCDMFFTYVIKVDKREIRRLYSKHIHVLSLFLLFPGKLPLCGKCE